MGNSLRIPFAEWLFRMSEARLPPQARELAIYAVVFRVKTNEELAVLAGMDTKGIADKTYNGWRRRLLAEGFVILKAVTIGRATSIEVFPALKEIPVTFTDITPRDPRKFYERTDQSRSYERTVEVTDDDIRSAVEVTDETRNSYGSVVEVTGGSRARIESSLREDNSLLEGIKSPFYPPSAEQRVRFENGRLTLFNGLEQFWLGEFGDRELLDLALMQAAGYVQPNSFKPLEAQVSAQLARMARDKRDKDARYEKAVKSNAKRAPTADEGRIDRWARKMREIEAAEGSKS